MLQRVIYFLKTEDVAVTVDWVVLCAGIVALVVAILSVMETSTVGLATSIQTDMSSFFS